MAQRLQIIERELDLSVFYVVGDGEGPLSGELRIATATRRAYAGEVKKMRTYRSASVVVHVECYVRGKASVLRLKSAVEQCLRDARRHIRGSWWRVSADEISRIVQACAVDERIRVMSEADARNLETEELRRITPRGLGV